MRNFLKKIGLFLMLLTLTCVVIEFMLRQIPNDYRNKKMYLDKNSDYIEIIFLGGSHSLFGLNPDYTKQRSFNASNVSQSLDYDLEILQKYKNKWSSLKYVVIPISYSTLFYKLRASKEAWRIKNYSLYYKIKTSAYLPYNSEILNGQLLNHILRLYSYYIKKIKNLSCTELGWGNSYRSTTSKDLNKTGKEAALRHLIVDNQYFDEVTGILDSIIDFTHKHDIKLILFTPPAYKSYRDNLNDNQLDWTIQTLTKTVKKNSNCYFINLLDDPSFTYEDFYDGDHLNEIGAKKLTLKIDSIISCK
jgi:hypothetical protein